MRKRNCIPPCSGKACDQLAMSLTGREYFRDAVPVNDAERWPPGRHPTYWEDMAGRLALSEYEQVCTMRSLEGASNALLRAISRQRAKHWDPNLHDNPSWHLMGGL